ncbi:hypothetical protein [Actinospica sp.]|uniref:hypothetical protein n=1 Tax=Actinospica sp. TaxID=1872142 RepID=UPI002C22895D|nr:hypothetical protein [Actinospica sp.]HWG28446.1 hypothetical protein [Actinospica sp.]
MGYDEDPRQAAGPQRDGEPARYGEPAPWTPSYREEPSAHPASYPPRSGRSRSAAPPPPAPGRSGRRGARAEAASVAPPAGPSRVNDDLDLDEVDPKGHARKQAAEESARAANPKRRSKALRAARPAP